MILSLLSAYAQPIPCGPDAFLTTDVPTELFRVSAEDSNLSTYLAPTNRYHALAYRISTGALYGWELNSNNLVQVDASGLTTLGKVDLNGPGGNINATLTAGTFSPEGSYYLIRDANLYVFDVDTLSADLFTLSSNPAVNGDIVYYEGTIYGIQDTNTLVAIDPVGLTVSTSALSGELPAGNLPWNALWRDAGHLVAVRSDGAVISFDPNVGSATDIGSIGAIAEADGAACGYAPQVSFAPATLQASQSTPIDFQIRHNGVDINEDGIDDAITGTTFESSLSIAGSWTTPLEYSTDGTSWSTAAPAGVNPSVYGVGSQTLSIDLTLPAAVLELWIRAPYNVDPGATSGTTQQSAQLTAPFPFDLHLSDNPATAARFDTTPVTVDSYNPDPDGDGLLSSEEYDGVDLALDSDGDGIADFEDVSQFPDCPTSGSDLCTVLVWEVDADQDGLPDHLDSDSDNDGLGDDLEGLGDFDGDGVPDRRDPDSDNDGVTDPIEAGGIDTDGDGQIDGGAASFIQSDSDGSPDHLDEDSDDDGIPDTIEGLDGDHDGGPDIIIFGSDHDGDGLYDAIDPTFGGTAAPDPDFDGDGIPDRIDPDDDNDQIPTALELPVELLYYKNVDSDGDGLEDGVEDANHNGLAEYTLGDSSSSGSGETDPRNADTDNDGLDDGAELTVHITDPLDVDTDDGGISDGEEVNLAFTDPLDPTDDVLADCNGDGVSDVVEQSSGVIDPCTIDEDNDGLGNGDEIVIHGTLPSDPDTDGDGLSDGAEVLDHLTNPTADDTDADTLLDGDEIARGTNPNSADSDGDTLPDGDEVFLYGSDPTLADTDGDTLDDDDELLGINGLPSDPTRVDSDGDGVDDPTERSLGIDPLMADTDQGGLPDGLELQLGLDPTLSSDDQLDQDQDGLLQSEEIALGSDPFVPDTDGDGLLDGDERNRGTDPTNPDTDNDGSADGAEVEAGTDPLSADSDRDGVLDGDEITNGTDPLDSDSDDDGLLDGDELTTDPNVADTDADGMLDGAEVDYGTDPTEPDTDGGGVLDGQEILDGTDPLNGNDDVPKTGRYLGGCVGCSSSTPSGLGFGLVLLLPLLRRNRS